MELQTLKKELVDLKNWINDPANKNKLEERKSKLTRISHLKRDIRSFALQENEKRVEEQTIRNDPNTKVVYEEEDFTKAHIDTYRYHKLYTKLNDKYIVDNCTYKIGDMVGVEGGNKVGVIAEILVYPTEVKRVKTGIFAKLFQIKQDGTASKKMLRRSRLDDRGFPIEELALIK